MNEQELQAWQTETHRLLVAELAAAEEQQRKRNDPQRAERYAFAIQIAFRRSQKNLSQAELARKTGISRSTLVRIESGTANPGFNTLLRITKALEASLVLE